MVMRKGDAEIIPRKYPHQQLLAVVVWGLEIEIIALFSPPK